MNLVLSEQTYSFKFTLFLLADWFPLIFSLKTLNWLLKENLLLG